jgi:hypothetical protein
MPTKDQFWDERQECEEVRKTAVESMARCMREVGIAEHIIAAVVALALTDLDQYHADLTGENN